MTSVDQVLGGRKNGMAAPSDGFLGAGAFAVDMDEFDQLVAQAETREKKWSSKFRVGDEVEAVWVDDQLWYAARIVALLEDERMYRVVFVEYGNEQDTEEAAIRPTVSTMFSHAEAHIAGAAEAEAARQAEVRANFQKREHALLAGMKASEKRRVSSSGSQLATAFEGVVSDAPLDTKAGLTAEERKKLIMEEARKLGLQSSSPKPRMLDLDNVEKGRSLSVSSAKEKPRVSSSGKASRSSTIGSSGLSAEERKALILEEARKLGAEKRVSCEFVVVGDESLRRRPSVGEMPQDDVWQTSKLSPAPVRRNP